ncbi:MAG: hypothetical protein FJ109_13465 [Deltaproteobacteria bacterium]|nr:hypothetical protein [Deltaproteobacteria bacterium]
MADQTGKAESTCVMEVAGAAAAAMVAAESAVPEQEEVHEEQAVRLEKPVRCVVCGRKSQWVVWWPSPEWRRPVPGYRRC